MPHVCAPGWGTVLLLGLGGIWVEALGDVKTGRCGRKADRRGVAQPAHGQAARRYPGRAASGHRGGRAGLPLGAPPPKKNIGAHLVEVRSLCNNFAICSFSANT
jgi:hypothetical protein